jgi:hypothetical protein
VEACAVNGLEDAVFGLLEAVVDGPQDCDERKGRKGGKVQQRKRPTSQWTKNRTNLCDRILVREKQIATCRRRTGGGLQSWIRDTKIHGGKKLPLGPCWIVPKAYDEGGNGRSSGGT